MLCPDQLSLSAFADGELEAAEAAEIAEHVRGCAACRTFVDELHRLDAWGGSALRGIKVTSAPALPAVQSERDGKATLIEGGDVRRVKLLRASPVLLLIRASFRRPLRIPLRPMALAAAAVLMAGMLVALWLIAHTRQGPRALPAPGRWAKMVATEDRSGSASADEAFARWAAPYRELRIPLVPIEEAGRYNPPQIRPDLPGMAAR